MNYTTIERPIKYSIASGNKKGLFDPIAVNIFTGFVLQFKVSSLAVDFTSKIVLSVSNDGTNFTELDPAGTHAVILTTAGTNYYCIFVGKSDGVSFVQWITADFIRGGAATGSIDQVIMSGKNS